MKILSLFSHSHKDIHVDFFFFQLKSVGSKIMLDPIDLHCIDKSTFFAQNKKIKQV